MLDRFKHFWQSVMLAPFVNLFIRLGISPDAVTLVGTAGVTAGALIFFPQGYLLGGVLFITAFVFSDLIDGAMARKTGRTSKFGAFFDSTLDRIGDAAIFGGLVLYFAGVHANLLAAGLALACLILGFVVSYSKARAEGLGMTANVGIAERADRLLAVLLATFLVGFGVSVVLLVVVLALLSVASLITVVQRMVAVRRQVLAMSPDQHTPGVSTP